VCDEKDTARDRSQELGREEAKKKQDIGAGRSEEL